MAIHFSVITTNIIIRGGGRKTVEGRGGGCSQKSGGRDTGDMYVYACILSLHIYIHIYVYIYVYTYAYIYAYMCGTCAYCGGRKRSSDAEEAAAQKVEAEAKVTDIIGNFVA